MIIFRNLMFKVLNIFGQANKIINKFLILMIKGYSCILSKPNTIRWIRIGYSHTEKSYIASNHRKFFLPVIESLFSIS